MDLMRDAIVKDLMRDAIVKNDNMRDAVVKNDLLTHEGHREWNGTEDIGHHYVHRDSSESCQEYGNCHHYHYDMMRDAIVKDDDMRDAIVKDLMRDAIVKNDLASSGSGSWASKNGKYAAKGQFKTGKNSNGQKTASGSGSFTGKNFSASGSFSVNSDEMRDAIVKDLMRDAVVKNDLGHEAHHEWNGTEDVGHHYPYGYIHRDTTESCQEYGNCHHYTYDMMRDAVVKDQLNWAGGLKIKTKKFSLGLKAQGGKDDSASDLMRDAIVKDLMRDAIVKNDNMRDAIVKDDEMRDAIVKDQLGWAGGLKIKTKKFSLGLKAKGGKDDSASDLMRDAIVKDLMRDAIVKNDNMRDAIVKDLMRDAIVKN